MRANETKRMLAAGKPALGLFIASASMAAAETIGGLGFDWVLVDLQHGETNLDSLSGMLTAVSATRATPFVRVPINEAMQIGRALDLGAYGIIVPLVNTVADAEAAVRAAKYPPKGERSWGPIRGALYGGSDYFQRADDETMLFVMIETREAVENVHAILATPGVDGCLVGTNDLSISLGLSPAGTAGAQLEPVAEEAILAVVAACEATGKIPGIQLYTAEAVNTRIRQGYRFIGMGTDLRLLGIAAATMLGAIER